MTEEKFQKSSLNYLDIGKNVTDALCNICIDSKEEYTVLEVINGVSTGLYMFLKAIAKQTNSNTLDLYELFDRWIKHMDSLMEEYEVQTQEGISGSENKVVGETTPEL